MRIDGLPAEPIICREVRFHGCLGEHPFCRAALVIPGEQAEKYLEAAENRTGVNVTDDDGECILSGFVYSCSIAEKVSETTAELIIYSRSVLLSEKGEERLYQCPTKTLNDILSDFPDAEIGEGVERGAVLEEIIYQHNSDDFSFLKMVADRCGCILAVTEEGRISFGRILNPGAKLFLSSEDRRRRVFSPRLFSERGRRGIEFKALKKLPVGSEVEIDGSVYLLAEVTASKEFHEEVYSYVGYAEQSEKQCAVLTGELTAQAEVMDNNDPEKQGRVQVRFLNYQDNAKERAWIPLLTPFIGRHSGGFVMIPDVGDHVVVHITDGIPYVIGSLRKECIPENCSDVNNKYLAMDKTVIEVDDRHIRITQGDKTSCVIKDGEVVLELDKTAVQANCSSVIADADKIQLQANQTLISGGQSKLTLEESQAELSSTGSSLSLTSGASELSGSSIKLSSPGRV